MANPYITLGAAQGLENARRRFRDERMENEDRAMAAEDRTERKGDLAYARERRKTTDSRADEEYKYETEERPLRRRALTAQVEGTELSTAEAKRQSGWAQEDRPLAVESNKLSLEAAKADFEHGKTSRARESEMHDIKIREVRDGLRDEGLDRMLDALEGGAQPDQAVELFNSKGKNGIRPGSLSYDQATGKISFTGRDGHQFNGTLKQLRSLLPENMRGAQSRKLMNVTAGASLYDPASGQWIQPPAKSQPGAQGRGGKLSPFNPQTHGKQSRDLFFQAIGGEWDNDLQKFQIPKGMGEKASYGGSLIDQTIRITEDEGMTLGPAEINDIVVNVMQTVKTTSEAMTEAKAAMPNADQNSIAMRAQEIVDASKIKASQKLRQNINMVRSTWQQNQTAQTRPHPPMSDAAGPDPAAQGEQMEPPPAEELREGYVQRYDDGTAWTLQGGRPVQVE